MSWRPCKLSHLVSWMSENDASGENTNGAISSVDLSSCLLVQSEHHAVSHSTSMSRLTSKHLAVHYLLIMQKSQVCYYTNGLQRHGHKGNCFWTIYRGHGYSPEPSRTHIYIYVYYVHTGIQAHRHTHIYIHTVYTHMYLHMSIEEPHRARHLWCCENRSDIFPCLELPAEHQELCRKSMINSIQSRWRNATVEWLPSTNGRTFLAAWKWDIMRLSAIRAAVSATLNPLGNSLTLVILSHVFRPYTVCLSLCFFWDQSIWLTTSSKSCSCFVRSPIICAIPQRDVRKSSQGSSCVSWGTTWNFVEAFPQPHTLCILGHWWCHSGSALNVPGL